VIDGEQSQRLQGYALSDDDDDEALSDIGLTLTDSESVFVTPRMTSQHDA